MRFYISGVTPTHNVFVGDDYPRFDQKTCSLFLRNGTKHQEDGLDRSALGCTRGVQGPLCGHGDSRIRGHLGDADHFGKQCEAETNSSF